MASTSSNSSDLGGHETYFVCSTNETEHGNPDSPKSFISEITDNKTNSVSPMKSFSGSSKRTLNHAELNNSADEANENSPKKLRSINNEESNFSKLFDTAVRSFQKCKGLKDEDIYDGVQVIIDSFRYYKGNQFSDVDFKNVNNICGYLYRYAPYSAGLTRYRTLEALSSCEELLSRIKVPSIKIISLGSGPGCDVIGLCSALYEHEQYQNVKITLVDSVQGWISAFNLLEFFTREGDYGKASSFFQNCNVSTTFLRTNLSSDADKDETYLSALKEADVILVNKLFSILTETERERIDKKIVEEMKIGAMLLFIDSPNYFFKNLSLMYSNPKYEEYNFQGEAINRFSCYIARDTKAQISVYMKLSE